MPILYFLEDEEILMRENDKENPIIIANGGVLNGLNWVISGEMTLGRDQSCDVVINDRQVSRFHSRIEIGADSTVQLIDLNSKNGTYLNGELISEPNNLNDGDEIKIALAQSFLFISSDSTIPLHRESVSNADGIKRLMIDQKARIVWVGDKEISPPLSVSQFDLLQLLYSNENEVITREKIVEDVWGATQAVGVSEQAIDALVRRLRDRLKEIDPDHEYIHTVRGVGFMLRNKNF